MWCRLCFVIRMHPRLERALEYKTFSEVNLTCLHLQHTVLNFKPHPHRVLISNQLLQCRCMVSINQVRICGCSEVCGEVHAAKIEVREDLW